MKHPITKILAALSVGSVLLFASSAFAGATWNYYCAATGGKRCCDPTVEPSCLSTDIPFAAGSTTGKPSIGGDTGAHTMIITCTKSTELLQWGYGHSGGETGCKQKSPGGPGYKSVMVGCEDESSGSGGHVWLNYVACK